MLGRDPTYLIYEYLSPHYADFNVQEMAGRMADCGLDIGCGIKQGTAHTRRKILSKASRTLETAKTPIARQDLADTILGERFREQVAQSVQRDFWTSPPKVSKMEPDAK